MNPLPDDIFHSCALLAFVEVAQETGIFPPDSETVKIRAYKYYEQDLAENDPRTIKKTP